MKQTVLLTGSGLVANRLTERLSDRGYAIRFLSRRKKADNYFLWDIDKNYIDDEAFNNVSHIVHLSGANVAAKPWTDKRKKEIVSSRVDSARLILNALERRAIKVKSFISASAVGYYGVQTTDIVYRETDRQGNDFLATVCGQWEAAADAFAQSGTAHRVVKLRIGVVLSAKGGFVPKVSTPIRYHFAPVFGVGAHYVPWIHIDDLCGMIEYAIENEDMTGVFNAVSPMHVTGKVLTKSIAKSMNKSTFMLEIPKRIAKLIFGEMSALLLEGSRVSSEKIGKRGFTFMYPTLTKALKNL